MAPYLQHAPPSSLLTPKNGEMKMANAEMVFVEQQPRRKYNAFNIIVFVLVGLICLVGGTNLWWFPLCVLLPTVIANARCHNNALAITALNVVMFVVSTQSPPVGFVISSLGWTIALVWACLNQRRD